MKSCIADLYSKLGENKMNALKQKGKSDIEPQNYVEKIEEWYNQIVKLVSMNPPKDYVKAICITQDSCQIIKNIKYQYYDKNDYTEDFSINLFWM